MLIQILTPFAIFLAAEHFHVSGILAVVGAGIVHGMERDRETSPDLTLRIMSRSTWSVILYLLNGLVFVLLGLQIPNIVRESFREPAIQLGEAIIQILWITAALLLLRWLWVYASWQAGRRLRKFQVRQASLRETGMITLGGVRGAVTLAGAFSIPYVLADGSPFPERSLMILNAAGVILMTLAAASVFLPLLAVPKRDPGESGEDQAFTSAKVSSYRAAVRVIREMATEENREAAYAVISVYNQAIRGLTVKPFKADETRLRQKETELRLQALEAECRYIVHLTNEKRIDRETSLFAKEYIRKMELAVTNRLKYRSLVLWTLFRRTVLRFIRMLTPHKGRKKRKSIKRETWLQLKINMSQAAIRELKSEITPETKPIVYEVIGEYGRAISKYKTEKHETSFKAVAGLERELQEAAFQAERDEVQHLYEDGRISMETARKLRREIDIREAYWISSDMI